MGRTKTREELETAVKTKGLVYDSLCGKTVISAVEYDGYIISASVTFITYDGYWATTDFIRRNDKLEVSHSESNIKSPEGEDIMKKLFGGETLFQDENGMTTEEIICDLIENAGLKYRKARHKKSQ